MGNTCATRRYIKKILATPCIYVFHMALTINTDYFHKQPLAAVLCKVHGLLFVRQKLKFYLLLDKRTDVVNSRTEETSWR